MIRKNIFRVFTLSSIDLIIKQKIQLKKTNKKQDITYFLNLSLIFFYLDRDKLFI